MKKFTISVDDELYKRIKELQKIDPTLNLSKVFRDSMKERFDEIRLFKEWKEKNGLTR